MKTSLDFLIAARQCEIAELRALADTATLVEATARLVHALQRERGFSNLYLASQGERFARERDAQTDDTDRLESALRAHFDRLATPPARPGPGHDPGPGAGLGAGPGVGPGHGARLCARIAFALQGLEALPALRSLVRRGAWLPARATAAYARLIGALLAVVFEAADTAADAQVCRLLVGLFHLMQAKELAGQERALGASLFASGRAAVADQQRLQFLIESQARALDVFVQCARETGAARCVDAVHAVPADLERLRRVLCADAQGVLLDPDLSARWFDACSHRIDAMMAIEAARTADLRALCVDRRIALEGELAALCTVGPQLGAPASGADLLAALDEGDDAAAPHPAGRAPAPSGPVGGDPVVAGGALGPNLERSMLALVQAQARRLQSMTEELDAARAALDERKLIERAKGLLMARHGVSEEAAYALLRQSAMHQGRRLADVARALLV
ncbi:MAG TPA: nitrate- and nitrite sensing domain-containing protein [Quisquiliibacterium sp.]|nr:nitrate- and nitrite sensing domain-containing protein [Quisquiliibacterium sp.]